MNGHPPASWLLRLAIFTLCILSPASAAPATPDADPIVMTIDGEPVSVSEYTLVMEGQVSSVFNYFKGKHDLDDHLGYWKDDGSPENPIRRLRKVVTEELKRIKTIQSLAKRRGVTGDISFAAFQRKLEQENARRLKAVENREVIYGPRQYQPYRYFYFELADLEQAALEAYQKDPANAVPEAEIEAFYQEHKLGMGDRPLSDARAPISRQIQKKNHTKLIETLTAQAKVETNGAVLAGIAPRHDP